MSFYLSPYRPSSVHAPGAGRAYTRPWVLASLVALELACSGSSADRISARRDSQPAARTDGGGIASTVERQPAARTDGGGFASTVERQPAVAVAGRERGRRGGGHSTNRSWTYDVTALNLPQRLLDVTATVMEKCSVNPELPICPDDNSSTPPPTEIECRGFKFTFSGSDPKDRNWISDAKIFWTNDARYSTGDLPNLVVQFHFQAWTYDGPDTYIAGDYNSVWDLDVGAKCGLLVTPVYGHVDRRTFEVNVEGVAPDIEDLCKEGVAAATERAINQQFSEHLGMFSEIIAKDCSEFRALAPTTPRGSVALGLNARKTIDVTFANTGTVPWNPGRNHDVGLGLVGPNQTSQNSPCWPLARPGRWFVPEVVAPGKEHTFKVALTGPSAPTKVECQFQMVRGKDSSQNQNHWFGPILSVDVVSQPPIRRRP